MSYINHIPATRPPPDTSYAAMSRARQVFFRAHDQWIADAQPAASDITDEIEATLSVLSQLARLQGTI
jgi:hypothetical protein